MAEAEFPALTVSHAAHYAQLSGAAPAAELPRTIVHLQWSEWGPHLVSQEFSQYLKEAVTSEPERQQQRLAGWQGAPYARYCHPREEHLIPLHVVAGASLCRPATVIFDDTLMGAPCTSFQYA